MSRTWKSCLLPPARRATMPIARRGSNPLPLKIAKYAFLGICAIGAVSVHAGVTTDTASVAGDRTTSFAASVDPLDQVNGLLEIAGDSAVRSPNHNWVSFWEPAAGRSDAITGQAMPATTKTITTDAAAADAANTRPLLVPLPSAWSAGLSGLLVLGTVAAVRRLRRGFAG